MKAVFTLVLPLILMGCAARTAQDADTARALMELSDQAGELARLRELNAQDRERIRELEGQLALAQAEARDLRAGAAALPPRDTVTLGTDESETERADPEDEEQPFVEPDDEEDDGAPRPMLRLYGTPAAPLGSGPTAPLALPPRPEHVPPTLPVTGPAAQGAPPAVPLPATVSRVPRAPARDGAADQYRTALALVRDRRFAEALAALNGFLATHAGHPYEDNAVFWRGEVYYAQRQYRRALAEFEGLVDRFPRGNKVADALLKIGMCHKRMGNMERARTFFRRVQREFPETVAAHVASREEAS